MMDENINTNMDYSAFSYNFCFVLYPDSISYRYMDLLKNVKALYTAHSISSYAYILHDLDVVVDSDILEGRYRAEDLGKPRKSHYHLLVNFKYQKSYRAVLKLLGLYGSYSDLDGNLHLIYPFDSSTAVVHSYRNYLKYMLHRTPDSASKHQYPVDKMITSDPDLVNRILSDNVVIDDVMLFKDIVHFIDHSGDLDMRAVYNYCNGISQDHLAIYFKPKFYRTIKDFVDNHNTSLKKVEVKVLDDRTNPNKRV